MKKSFILIAVLAAALAAAPNTVEDVAGTGRGDKNRRGEEGQRAERRSGGEPDFNRDFCIENHIVYCTGPGKRCAAPRLVKAKRFTAFHGEDLEKATAEIDAILDGLAGGAPPGRHLSFLVTPYAALLAWVEVPPAGRTPKGPTIDTDKESVYRELRLSMTAYKPKATRHWVAVGGGLCYCPKGGDSEVAGRLISAPPSAAHDARLEEATTRINAILNRAEAGRKDPKTTLALLMTPKGLFLAFDIEVEGDGPWSKGVQFGDEDAKVFDALGI